VAVAWTLRRYGEGIQVSTNWCYGLFTPTDI